MRNTAYSLAWHVIVLVVLLSSTLVSCARTDHIQAPAPSTNSSLAFAMRRPLTLGVVVDKEMRVVALDPGGAAEAAGMKVGDQFVSLNGIAFSSKPDAIKNALLVLGDSSPDHADVIMGDSAAGEMEARPVPAQLVGQPDLPPLQPATPSVLKHETPQATVVIQRNAKTQNLSLDLSIFPYYDVLPTPTAMPSDSGLLYF